MVITVATVTIMQFAIAEIVKMVAMGHLLMALSLVITGAGDWGTGRRIRFVNRYNVFVIVIAMEKVQMPIVQVINVSLVQNGLVTALLAMNMLMFTAMGRMLHNCVLS